MTPALSKELHEILGRSLRGEALSREDLEWLVLIEDATAWQEIFKTARELTLRHFHQQLCFFAPLYFSSFCINECTYCGFRRSNKTLARKTLTVDEFVRESRALWNSGQRTMLLIAGEHPKHTSAFHMAEYLKALKREQMDFFILLESGPLEIEEYRELRDLGIHQALLFQETYDRETYARYHQGPKRDFDWRLGAMSRAFQGGIERIGIGFLLGLFDWRSDFLSLMDHARSFRAEQGRDPVSISLPRLRSALGIDDWYAPETEVSDEHFKRIIALLRLALPSVGIILTTRESASFRDEILKEGFGITHVSAGCSTVPGGYSVNPEADDGQFHLQDQRSLREVLSRCQELGYSTLLRPDAMSL